MKPLRTIVVGFGFMGRTHAANLRQLQPFELCGIVDSRSRQELAGSAGGNIQSGAIGLEQLPGVPLFARLEECLATIRPDAVVIALPTAAHAATTRLCLERGCHVFLEKPICLDVGEGEALLLQAEAAKRTFMVGHCVRFFPAYEILLDAIRSGSHGKLRLLTMERFTGTPNWGVWKDAAIRASNGGALFDLLIHDIDIARAALGDPAEVWTPPGLVKTFGADYVNATWRYPSGTMVMIRGGHLFPPDRPFECGYSALFENGCLLYTSHAPDYVLQLGSTGRHELSVAGAVDGYRKELEYFGSCAQSGQSPDRCPPQDAVAAVRLAARHLVTPVV